MLTLHDRPSQGTGLVSRTGTGAADGAVIGPATLWIDLFDPTRAEEIAVEAQLGIEVPTRAEMREIESSSRLYSENGAAYMTAFIVYDIEAPEPKSSTITFILAGRRLVTVRYCEPKAIPMLVARAEKGTVDCDDGTAIMIGLVETLISRTADLIERVQDEVSQLAHQLFQIKGGQQTRTRRLDVILRATGKEGDIVTRAQESAMSLERLLNHLQETIRRQDAASPVLPRIATARADLVSLNDHMKVLADRTSFLLSATLGMTTTEQNQIIKLFSVMAVMLMPPTLVASIYGMNFRNMPELGWEWGYPLALALMVVAALVPFVYFKRKGWM